MAATEVCAQERVEIKWQFDMERRGGKKGTPTNRSVAIDRHVVKCSAVEAHTRFQ